MDVVALSEEWQRIGYLGLDAKVHDIDNFTQNLRFLVARDYGWLASELFDIEGKLGWGPGNREWEDDLFPPPTEDSYAHMSTFLQTLCAVRKDTELLTLLADASHGRCKTPMGRRLMLSLRASKARRGGVIAYYYGKIANEHSAYALGGARIYLAMWTQQKRFYLSLAGLVRMTFCSLHPLMVRAETATRKIGRMFQQAENFRQQIEPSAMIMQAFTY